LIKFHVKSITVDMRVLHACLHPLGFARVMILGFARSTPAGARGHGAAFAIRSNLGTPLK
jgi:hypothetical protein